MISNHSCENCSHYSGDYEEEANSFHAIETINKAKTCGAYESFPILNKEDK